MPPADSIASSSIVQELLRTGEPSVRYRIRAHVLGESADELRSVRREIAESPRVRALLSERNEEGRIPRHAYEKWRGAHWVLAVLADLDYPPGDTSLVPLRDQVYERWLSPSHTREFVCESRNAFYRRRVEFGVPIMNGRARRCASQEGNALYATLKLGIADERADRLAENLLRWQWDDGGWNCDKNPNAAISSFNESLIPMRGLWLHAQATGSAASREAAERASELFLTRSLYKRKRTGEPIKDAFITLHYPAYGHYDALYGLKVMAECGFIDDPRCSDALDLLESKRLSDGGFPAEARHYRPSDPRDNGVSIVDWGGSSRRKSNPFITADALVVLKAAGRAV
ncbi:hypothetical protein FJZ36_18580 [Candidatus Poribacteria bacterium]|nr:hypothetical protein [Candidatus Poribacteria bacterium]